jgi:hypothetical protein
MHTHPTHDNTTHPYSSMSHIIPRSTTCFLLYHTFLPFYSLPLLPCPGLLSPFLGLPQRYNPHHVSLHLFCFGICFAVQPHHSTLLWISVCIITISPGLLPVLLLLLVLHSSVYSLMVLFLFILRLCPTLPTLMYADLCGGRFLVATLCSGGSTM